MLLGVTSPKIKTTMVMTMVATLGPCSSPNNFTKSKVATDAQAMFTILLPIKMVERRLSKFSSKSKTSLAFLSPFSARFLTRMRFREEKAVSVAEK